MPEPTIPSLTRSDDIQAAIVAALTGNTAAGANVFTPRTWPVALDGMPILMVQSPRELKTSQGPNAPSYDVVTTIRVIGRITAKALASDATSAALLVALGVLQAQIEIGVINDPDLFEIISEIVSVESVNEVKGEGQQPIGEITMDFACKFYQGPEWFHQPVLTPITSLAAYGDLLNVFDPDGTYTKPFNYPVEAAPRSEGPDGRVEAGAVITISQDEP